MWFLFALITTVAWGAADLFYKRGADEGDRYSHLKTAMTVGVVMGLHACAMLLFTNMGFDPMNLLVYLPVSLLYILSMVIGYLGLRYLELSVSSPVQNSSGAVTAILCLVILGQTMDALSAVGVCLACFGVILLGVLDRRDVRPAMTDGDRKYRVGFAAFLLPVLYCVIDALGTFFDAYYLDDVETTPLRNVTEDTIENVANTSYELTFLFVAVVLLVFLLVKRQKIFDKRSGDRGAAAILETAGQFTYVYAMSGNGAVAAPMVSSYCIVSLLLSRIFLKEKLSLPRLVAVLVVVAGIVCLGISEGLAA